MNKKILISVIAIAMAAVLVIAFAGCNKAPTVNEEQSTEAQEIVTDAQDSATASNEITDTASVINNVIALYAEDEKFAAMGGDMNNVKDGEAGMFDMSDADAANATLHISADLIAKTADAASYVHMMNANTFTAAAFKLADGTDAAQFANELKASILSTQWMCGFPEKLVMYTVNGEYTLYAVGAMDLLDNFSQKVAAVYGDSAVLVFDEAVE